MIINLCVIVFKYKSEFVYFKLCSTFFGFKKSCHILQATIFDKTDKNET